MPRPGVVRAVLALLALMAGLLVLVGGPALNLAAAGAHVVRVQGYSYDTASQNASEGARSHAAVQRPVSLSAGRCGVAAAGPSVSTGAGVAAEGALPAGYSSFKAAKTGMGSPGTGNVFDHVVEQSQIARSGFKPQEIHNPFNMNPVSAGTNQLKANYYSTKQFFTGGGTVRDWLTGQSFVDQYEFGMDVLRRIENGIPLP